MDSVCKAKGLTYDELSRYLYYYNKHLYYKPVPGDEYKYMSGTVLRGGKKGKWSRRKGSMSQLIGGRPAIVLFWYPHSGQNVPAIVNSLNNLYDHYKAMGVGFVAVCPGVDAIDSITTKLRGVELKFPMLIDETEYLIVLEEYLIVLEEYDAPYLGVLMDESDDEKNPIIVYNECHFHELMLVGSDGSIIRAGKDMLHSGTSRNEQFPGIFTNNKVYSCLLDLMDKDVRLLLNTPQSPRR